MGQARGLQGRPVLHPVDIVHSGAAAANAQARRHVRRVRSLRRPRLQRRKPGRPLSQGHPFPLGSARSHQRASAAAAQFDRTGQQRASDGGPDEPRFLLAGPSRPSARHDLRRPLEVPVGWRVLRAARHPQLRSRDAHDRVFLSSSPPISPIFSSFAATVASGGARSKTKSFADGVTFSYHGLDGVVRRSAIRFDPAPAEIDHESARFVVAMRPHEHFSLFMAISCEDQQELRPARYLLRRLARCAAGAACGDRARRRGRNVQPVI